MHLTASLFFFFFERICQTYHKKLSNATLTLSQTSPGSFTGLQDKSFENTQGKGEIARSEQFLLFPQCFLPIWLTLCYFHQIYYCRVQTLSVWNSEKFDVWERVKGVLSEKSQQTREYVLDQSIRSVQSGSIFTNHSLRTV